MNYFYFLIFYQKTKNFIKFFQKFFLNKKNRNFVLKEVINYSRIFKKAILFSYAEMKTGVFFLGSPTNFFKFFLSRDSSLFHIQSFFLEKSNQKTIFFLKKFFVFQELAKIEKWVKLGKLCSDKNPFFISKFKQHKKPFIISEPKIKKNKIPYFLSFKNAKRIFWVGMWKRSFSYSIFLEFWEFKKKLIFCLEDYISYLSFFYSNLFSLELDFIPSYNNFFKFFNLKKKKKKLQRTKKKNFFFACEFINFNQKRNFLWNSLNEKKTPFLLKNNYSKKIFPKFFFFPRIKIFRKFIELFEKISNFSFEIKKLEQKILLITFADISNENCKKKGNFFFIKKNVLDLIKKSRNRILKPFFLTDFKLFKIKKNIKLHPRAKLFKFKKLLENLIKQFFCNLYLQNCQISFLRSFFPIFQLFNHFTKQKEKNKKKLKISRKNSFFFSFQPPIDVCEKLKLIGNRLEERIFNFFLLDQLKAVNEKASSTYNKIFYCTQKIFF